MEKNFILIIFYSLSGSVKNLAHAIADGVEDAGGIARIRTVPKISSNIEKIPSAIPDSGEIYCSNKDLIESKGIAIGSPTRFGSIAAPLKYFLDSTGELWATNSLENKPGIAFTSSSSMHGGQETTLFSLITFMLHHGMVVTGTPYSIEDLSKTRSGGTPYGPSHVENFNSSSELSREEYEIAKTSGYRLAKLALKLDV